MSKAVRYGYDRRHKYTVKGIDYCFIEEAAGGCVFQRVDGDLLEAFTREQMAGLIQAGQVEIVRNFYTLGRGKLRAMGAPENLNDLPWALQEGVLFVKAGLDEFMRRRAANPREVSLSDRSLRKVLVEIEQTLLSNGIAFPGGKKPKRKTKAGKKGPSTFSMPGPKAFRTQLRKYEDCGYNPMALVPQHHRCGNRSRRLDPRVQASVHEQGKNYCDERRPSIATCFEKHKADIENLNKRNRLSLKPASRNTFYAYINSLDKFHVEAGRRGIEAARKKFYISKGGIEVLRPFQRVEMDHWSVQLHSLNIDPDVLALLSEEDRAQLDTCRVNLCVSIDCASRAFAGMSASLTADASNAINTLRQTVSDKTLIARDLGALSPWVIHGTPEMIVTDCGSEFVDLEFRAAGIGLGIAMELARAGNPQLRARIERAFGTVNRQGLEAFTGRTFTNNVDRGDYPAEQRATLTIQELLDMLVAYVVDQYHNSPQDGLLGETPNNAWRRLTEEFTCPPPPGPNKLRSVFGIPLRRAVGTNGVRVLGLWFQSELIQKHRYQCGDGVTVDVKVDPQDIGAISVFIDGAWHAVPCRTRSMKQVAIATWISAQADLRVRFAAEAKLTEHIVRKAVEAREALHQRAIQRARLSPTTLTQKQLDREELESFRGLEILHEDDAPPIASTSTHDEPRDFLRSGVIPVTPVAASPTPAPATAPPPKSRPKAKAPVDPVNLQAPAGIIIEE